MKTFSKFLLAAVAAIGLSFLPFSDMAEAGPNQSTGACVILICPNSGAQVSACETGRNLHQAQGLAHAAAMRMCTATPAD